MIYKWCAKLSNGNETNKTKQIIYCCLWLQRIIKLVLIVLSFILHTGCPKIIKTIHLVGFWLWGVEQCLFIFYEWPSVQVFMMKELWIIFVTNIRKILWILFLLCNLSPILIWDTFPWFLRLFMIIYDCLWCFSPLMNRKICLFP